MNKQQTYEDLKAKVSRIMDDIKKDALEKLDHLQRSGVGILDDHDRNDLSYETPKDFVVAYAGEIKRQYRRLATRGNTKHARLISNYEAMM